MQRGRLLRGGHPAGSAAGAPTHGWRLLHITVKTARSRLDDPRDVCKLMSVGHRLIVTQAQHKQKPTHGVIVALSVGRG
jgi:hypothetical protein